MRVLRENTATRVTVGPFIDVGDGFTPELALTATNEHLTLIVDDAGVPTLVLDAVATVAGANDLVHITNDNAGYYDLELTAAQTNYTGRAVLSINYLTDHLPVFHEFQIVSAIVYDSLYTDGAVLNVNATQIAGAPVIVGTASGSPTAVLIPTNLVSGYGMNVANALVDRTIYWASNTTTVALRGQGALITGYATNGDITVGAGALSVAPVSGDVFVIA